MTFLPTSVCHKAEGCRRESALRGHPSLAHSWLLLFSPPPALLTSKAGARRSKRIDDLKKEKEQESSSMSGLVEWGCTVGLSRIPTAGGLHLQCWWWGCLLPSGCSLLLPLPDTWRCPYFVSAKCSSSIHVLLGKTSDDPMQALTHMSPIMDQLALPLQIWRDYLKCSSLSHLFLHASSCLAIISVPIDSLDMATPLKSPTLCPEDTY